MNDKVIPGNNHGHNVQYMHRIFKVKGNKPLVSWKISNIIQAGGGIQRTIYLNISYIFVKAFSHGPIHKALTLIQVYCGVFAQ